MPTVPDSNARALAGTLPLDPSADTVPMLDPTEAGRHAAEDERLSGEHLGTWKDGEINRMRDRGEGKSRPVPLPSAWKRTTAELRGGLWPGCYVLVGATGTGKTQWAFEVAYHAATGPECVPVLYIGLELDRAGMLARLAALGCRTLAGQSVPWSSLYLGERGALATVMQSGALEALAAAPLYLTRGEARGWAYTDLDGQIGALRRKHRTGPLLVILDFLQLVSSAPGEREDVRERIGGAAYAARMAAVEYDATVLVLSATARSFYPMFSGIGKVDGADAQKLGQGDPGRFIGTGKEAGEVEYAADGVIALCRDPADAQDRRSWLAVSKSRTGRPSGCSGWIAYNFDGTVFREDEAAAAERRTIAAPRTRGGRGEVPKSGFEGDT